MEEKKKKSKWVKLVIKVMLVYVIIMWVYVNNMIKL